MPKIVAFSPELRISDVKFNVEQIIDAYMRLKGEDVSLLFFPELCLTGTSCGDLFLNDHLLSQSLVGLNRIAEVTQDEDTMLLVSLPVHIEDKVYEVSALVADGEVLAFLPRDHFSKLNTQRKRWFDEWSLSDGLYLLEDGKEVYCCQSITCNDVEYRVCFDLDDIQAKDHGADILLVYTSNTEFIGRSQSIREKLKDYTNTRTTFAVTITPDMSESTGQGVCSGYAVAAKKGKVIADTELFSRSSLKVEVGCKDVNYTERDLDPCELAVMIQGHSLAQRLKKIWVSKIIIGISGGLDSTQALLAGIKALDILGYPHSNMIAVTMPCFGTTTRTKSNAQKLSELCGTDFREISIREAVTQHLKDIGHDLETADVAFENAQARERTQVLMDLANMENAIVLGTGDMSEAALGWCTFNGDHISMYNVNCNMTKTFLRQVVRYEAEHSEDRELSHVLLDVIDTPVSPELKPSEQDNISQRTEDILGPYEVLDYYLELFVKSHLSPVEVFKEGMERFEGKYSSEDMKTWLNQFIKRFFNNQFKRNCVPDGPRVIDYDLSPNSGWIMTSDTSNGSFMNLV